jgi:hypothetical protein
MITVTGGSRAIAFALNRKPQSMKWGFWGKLAGQRPASLPQKLVLTGQELLKCNSPTGRSDLP